MNDRFRTWARRIDLGLLSAARARFLLGALGVLLLGGVAVLIVGRAGRAMDPVGVRLRGPVAPHTAPGELVRVALGPAFATHDELDHREQLGAYLEKRLGRPVAVVGRGTAGELVELLATGKLQSAFLETGAYLDARRREVALEAVAVPSYGDATTTQSVVVVPLASPVETLADLRGRSFAYTDPLALGGHDYPIVALRRTGSEASSFFSRTVLTYSDGESLRSVRDGEVDGAAVDRRAYDHILATHGSWRGGLRVVGSSAPYGAGPVVVPESVPTELRRRLRRAWLEMHESAEGRLVLRALHITRFERPRQGLYDSAARLAAEARQGGGEGP